MAWPGYSEMPENMVRFLDWLCWGEEREVGQSQNDFAAVLGVSKGTLTKWKARRDFRKEWEARQRETMLSPDLIGDQLRELHKIATDPKSRPQDKINAINTYQKLTGAAAPERHQHDVGEETKVRQMSDDQLVAAAQELAARSNVTALPSAS
jgi:hypothetical protein